MSPNMSLSTSPLFFLRSKVSMLKNYSYLTFFVKERKEKELKLFYFVLDS